MADLEKTQRKGRGSNPNSKANLKPFKKGQSGNPSGPAPGYKHRGAIYEKLLGIKTKVTLPDKTVEELTLYEAIALGQAQSAMKGNTNAWKEIQDSLHGKLTDKLEHDGKIAILVEFDDGE